MSSGLLNVLPSRRNIVRFLFILLLIMLLSAAAIIIAWGIQHQTLNEEELADLSTLPQSAIADGLPIRAEIDLALDTFAEEYETTGTLHASEKTTKLFYIVPVYGVDEDGYLIFNYLLVYQCMPKNINQMDSVLEQTYTDVDDYTSLNLRSGLIRKLPDELIGFFNGWSNNKSYYSNGSFIDWCAESGVFGTSDKDVIKSKILPYMIVDTSGGMDFVWVLLPASSVIFLVMMLFIVIKRPIKNLDPDPNAAQTAPPYIPYQSGPEQ